MLTPTFLRHEVENLQNWREDCTLIPFIQFPSEWKINIIPPYGNALIRFRVELPSGIIKSIYLDNKNAIGWRGIDKNDRPIPYWEVYPVQGQALRCGLNEIENLLNLISDEMPEINFPDPDLDFT